MPDAAAWKQRSIYQLLTDRFAVTGGGNGGPDLDYLSRQYCGGTWQGVISKLDYIQGMGFDAVWISPVSNFLHSRDISAHNHRLRRTLRIILITVQPIMGTGRRIFIL